MEVQFEGETGFGVAVTQSFYAPWFRQLCDVLEYGSAKFECTEKDMENRFLPYTQIIGNVF